MSRFLSTAVVFAALAAVVGAQGSGRPSADEQKRLWRKNQSLIAALVDDSLTLAGHNGVLDRADDCTRSVESLAAAIDKAMREGDTARVVELGHHLRLLLDQGVVPTYGTARGKIEAGSDAEKDLFKHRDRGKKALADLETLLDNLGLGHVEIEELRRAVGAGGRRFDDLTRPPAKAPEARRP